MVECYNRKHPEYQRLRDLTGLSNLAIDGMLDDYKDVWGWKNLEAYPDPHWVDRWMRDNDIGGIDPHNEREPFFAPFNSYSDPFDPVTRANTTFVNGSEVKRLKEWQVADLRREKDQKWEGVTQGVRGKDYQDTGTDRERASVGDIVHGVLSHLRELQYRVVNFMNRENRLLKAEGKGEKYDAEAREKAIRDYCDRFVKDWIRDLRDTKGGGAVRFTPEGMEEFAGNVTNLFLDILTHYDVMDTEMPVKWRSRKGVLHAGSVDLLLRDRRTGSLGVVEIKTSFRGELEKSRFYRYNMEPLRQGKDSWLDELNMQTLAYQTMINETWRKHSPEDPDRKIVQWRGWLPLDIVGETRKERVKGKDQIVLYPYRISDAALRNNRRIGAGGVYLLMDRPEHLKRVAETFSAYGFELGGKYVSSLGEGIQTLSRAVRAMALKTGDTNTLKLFQNMNIDSDALAVFEAADEYLKQVNLIVASSAQPDMLDVAITTLENFNETLRGDFVSLFREPEGPVHDPDEIALLPIQKYITEIYHIIDRKTVDDLTRQIQSKLDAIEFQLRKLRESSIPACQRRLLVPLVEQVMTPRIKQAYLDNKLRQDFYDRLLREVQEKKQVYKESELWEKASKMAKESLDDPSSPEAKAYRNSFDQVINWFVGAGGATGESYQLMRQILNTVNSDTTSGLAVHLYEGFAQKQGLTHLQFSRNARIQLLLHLSEKTLDRITTRILEGRDRIRKLSDGVIGQKALFAKDYRGAYGFMIQEDADGHPSVVLQHDWKRFHEERGKEWRRIEKEYPGARNEDLRKEKRREWMAQHTTPAEWTLRKEGETERQHEKRISDTRRDRLIEVLLRKAREGVIPEGETRPVPGGEEGSSPFDLLLTVIGTSTYYKWDDRMGWNLPDKKIFDVTAYPALFQATMDAIEEVRASEWQPDEAYENPKYRAIMKLPKDDPRRLFYEEYLRITSLYDSIVPESKRLGTNLPSVMAEADEANLPTKERIKKRLWGGRDTHPYTLYQKQKAEDDAHQGKLTKTGEVLLDNGCAPLPYSGYENHLNPSNRSYNLGNALSLLQDSLVKYHIVNHSIPLLRAMTHGWKYGLSSMRAGTKGNETELSQYDQMLDLLDSVAGHYKGPKLFGFDAARGPVKAINSLASAVTWLCVSNPFVAFKSHLLSDFTVWNKYVGHDITPQAYVNAHFRALGNILMRGRTKGTLSDYLRLHDEDRLREPFRKGFLGGSGDLLSGFKNASYSLFRLSDILIKEMFADALLSSIRVFDLNGKPMGNWRENLVRDPKTGKLDLRETVKYWIPDFFRGRAGIRREIDGDTLLTLERRARLALSNTLSPQNVLYKPRRSLDGAMGRLFMSVRNVQSNIVGMDIHPEFYNPMDERQVRLQGTAQLGSTVMRTGERALVKGARFLNGLGFEQTELKKIADKKDLPLEARRSILAALGIATVYGIVAWLKNLTLPKKQRGDLSEALSGKSESELDLEKRERSDRLNLLRESQRIEPDNWLQKAVFALFGEGEEEEKKATHVLEFAHLVGSMFVTSYNPFEFVSFYQNAQNLDIVSGEEKKIAEVVTEILKASHGSDEKPPLGFLGDTWALLLMITGWPDNPYYQAKKRGWSNAEDEKAEGDVLGVDEDDSEQRPKWVLAIDRLNPHLGSLLRVARWMTGKGKESANFGERLESLFAPYNIRDRMLK